MKRRETMDLLVCCDSLTSGKMVRLETVEGS